MKLIKVTCSSCKNQFYMYRKSIVQYNQNNNKNIRKKLTDIFLIEILCINCFIKYHKYMQEYNLVSIGKLRYPEFSDDKWLTAFLL